METCKNCGEENPDGTTFCSKCGDLLSDPTDSMKTVPESPPEQGSAPENSGIAAPEPSVPQKEAAAITVPPYPPQRQQTEGFAIASMVLGIVGFPAYFVLPVTSILALIFGYSGLKRIRAGRGILSGEGMALAGVVLGWVGIGLSIIGLVIAVVGFTLGWFDNITTSMVQLHAAAALFC